MPNSTSAFVDHLEKLYGKYSADNNGEARADVGRFLLRRYQGHRETLAIVLDAIKEACPIRFGPPDVATILKAVVEYETAYKITVKPPVVACEESARPSPEEIVAQRGETLIDMERDARALGIDTNAEGWVATYCFALMARDRAGVKA